MLTDPPFAMVTALLPLPLSKLYGSFAAMLADIGASAPADATANASPAPAASAARHSAS